MSDSRDADGPCGLPTAPAAAQSEGGRARRPRGRGDLHHSFILHEKGRFRGNSRGSFRSIFAAADSEIAVRRPWRAGRSEPSDAEARANFLGLRRRWNQFGEPSGVGIFDLTYFEADLATTVDAHLLVSDHAGGDPFGRLPVDDHQRLSVALGDE